MPIIGWELLPHTKSETPAVLGQRRSVMVNDGLPPVNHREPPPDHRRNTTGLPINHHRTTSQQWSETGSIGLGTGRFRLGTESGRHVEPPKWATRHQRITTQPAQAGSRTRDLMAGGLSKR
nr:hypothetical protein [Tanacetum cinerariifolium]